MSWRICKIMEFEAAHFIPEHKGKCKNLHGHTYKVEVVIKGECLNEQGILMDFSDLKESMKNIIDGNLDHTCLNDLFMKPTAEVMAEWIGKEIGKCIPILFVVDYVRVWETSTSWAEWRP